MRIHRFSMVAVSCLLLIAKVSHAAGRNSKGSRQRSLAHVLVKVNGEQSAVSPGQSLHVYRGDELIFLDAFLNQGPNNPVTAAAIDVEEFEVPIDRNPAGARNERRLNIDTASMPRSTYRVVIRSGDAELGRIKLVVTEPRFDYAVVLVNGKPVTVRPGGRVALRPDDQIRLDFVRSNVPDPAKVAVEPFPGGGLRFKYRNRAFGQIHLPVNQAR